MVNGSTGWREQRSRLAAQVAQPSSQSSSGEQVARNPRVGQDATTRTMACPVCKALYTPAPAHQQLVLAPHIVLESAFMSMCHFCFRCRRAACPDCWDAVHGVCGACVAEAQLPFRTQVKPLSNAMPPLPQQQQVVETMHAKPVLVCIQHGRFYVKSLQPSTATPSHRMSRPVRVAAPGTQSGKDDGRPQGATHPHHSSPVPTMSALPPHDRHGRDGGGMDGWWGPLRASIVPPSGWITEALGSIEQWVTGVPGDVERWVTGALLVLLLTIVTMIVLAEASPSANAQIMHVFQIDIRSEVAYLIHLIGQLQW
ncbi:MAG: hypothetical protein ACYDER_18445 [Ktedonobacteraceae bacterium]